MILQVGFRIVAVLSPVTCTTVEAPVSSNLVSCELPPHRIPDGASELQHYSNMRLHDSSLATVWVYRPPQHTR